MSPGKELSIDKMKKCLLGKNICRMLSFSEHVDLGREKRERDVVKRLGFHALIFLLSEVEPSVCGKNVHTCVEESDHIRGPSRSELRGDCQVQRKSHIYGKGESASMVRG